MNVRPGIFGSGVFVDSARDFREGPTRKNVRHSAPKPLRSLKVGQMCEIRQALPVKAFAIGRSGVCLRLPRAYINAEKFSGGQI